MKIKHLQIFGIFILIVASCKESVKHEITRHDYFDVSRSDRLDKSILHAVTDEEFLEYGSRVAYVNEKGDTIIPFGKFAYYGTDSLIYYATVIKLQNKNSGARPVAIDRNQHVLFDLVIFDNGPDYFNEGLTRVQRNGKMGFANKYGHVVIPCIYDYARGVENGKAKVTFNAKEQLGSDEHRQVESDEWFEIEKQGRRIK